MSGQITDVASVEKWFKGNRRPFWSLKYQGHGTNDRTIARNDSITDINEAWDYLEQMLTMQTQGGRAQLEILQYGSEKGAQGAAVRTYVDLRDRFLYPQASAQPQVAGIGAIGDVQEYVDNKINLALMEREIEDLRAAINAPSSWMERLVDKVAESPHLSQLLQAAVMGFLTRGTGMQPMPAPVTGYQQPGPQPHHSTGHSEEEETEDDRVFWANIQAAATALEVDLPTLAVKLNALVQQNPAMAKSLIS